MILSVSRRTDIPAYYMPWLMNRLKEGLVHVRNPINRRQVSEIDISPGEVDFIVFWTKNAIPFEAYIKELKDYDYYIQYSLTGYEADVERRLPSLSDRLRNMDRLSETLGKKRLVWRYDPIFLSDKYTTDWHIENFTKLCARLEGRVERVIISWLDVYKKINKNLKTLNHQPASEETMQDLIGKLCVIAKNHNIDMYACAEPYDFSGVGVLSSKCIDDGLIGDILGQPVKAGKDKNQRATCGCIESVEIGAYNTCSNGCLYCYANYSDERVEANLLEHDSESTLLIGEVDFRDKVTKRRTEHIIGNKQITIYDDY